MQATIIWLHTLVTCPAPTSPMRDPIAAPNTMKYSDVDSTGEAMEVESSGSCPAMASCSSAASRTVRVIGPAWSRLEEKAMRP